MRRLLNLPPLVGKTADIVYKNYRGVTEDRKITVIRTFEGSTEYHPEHQTFLHAYCHERGETRDFAAKDIEKVVAVNEPIMSNETIDTSKKFSFFERRPDPVATENATDFKLRQDWEF